MRYPSVLIPCTCVCAVLATACSGSKPAGVAADSSGAATTVTPAPAAAVSSTPAQPNAQMQAVLDQLVALGPKPFETLTPAEARKQPTAADAVKALLKKEGKSAAPDPAVATVDRTIPGPAGSLPVRVFTPVGATGMLPVVVYYHGGGWVVADYNVYDAGARAISKLANVIVVSVNYREAPEHKFPASHNDALAAYQWARKNAASIHGDTSRVAVAGESAGGNLAVATALSARDKGIQLPSYVVAVYPIAGTDTTTASYIQNANAKPLSRAAMGWFLHQETSGAQDLTDPRLDLVHANLKGLPPTTVITDQIDPLMTEGAALAQRLKDAGVNTRYQNYNGVTHEFFGMGAVVDDAKNAEQFAADGLKGAFGQ